MISSNEETLQCLGLSNIQARIYITLVQHGRVSANTLSKHSNVARSEIYRIMAHFQKIGIVQKLIANPVMFEATPIEQALPALLDNKAMELNKVKKQTQDLIRTLIQKKCVKDRIENEPTVLLIPPTKAALNKRIELIENSQYLVKGLIPWKGYKHLLETNFKEVIKEAMDRGVKFQLLVYAPKKVSLPRQHYKFLNFLEENDCSLVITELDNSVSLNIFDDKDVLIFPQEKTGPHGSPLFCSNDVSIVIMANCYFKTQWKAATQCNN